MSQVLPFTCLCIYLCICLCICIFVRIWIADIISFQKIYGLRGTWGLTAVLQLIYELRKYCCRRVDGTGEIEGCTRGPRGPKKGTFKDLDNTPLNLLCTPLICNVWSNLIFGRRKLKSRLALDAFVCWQSSLSPWFICFCKLHFPTNCSSLILDFFSDCHLLILRMW